MANWLLLDEKKPLRYRKHALYAGDFGKLDSTGSGVEFSTNRAILERLAESVTELSQAGVAVPFATNHKNWEESGNRLGTVVGGVVENDALYLDIEFADEAARDQALRADVSVGLMDKFYDGRKQLHRTVLRHLASTSAPVIPGLEQWQQIAASFTGKTTDMGSLFELLGVESEELALSAVKDLQAKVLELSAPAEKHSPKLVKALKEARELQLSALVAQGEISPAVKTELVAMCCTDKSITLDLSHDGQNDLFDSLVKVAKLASKSQPVKASGRTEIELGHDTDSDPLDRAIAEFSKRFEARNGKK